MTPTPIPAFAPYFNPAEEDWLVVFDSSDDDEGLEIGVIERLDETGDPMRLDVARDEVEKDVELDAAALRTRNPGLDSCGALGSYV